MLLQKTKNVSEITRLNSENSRTKRAIEDDFKAIGKKQYELFVDGEGDERFKEDFDKIKAAFDTIAANEEKILALKDIVICPSCGKELEITSSFCGSCGAKIEHPEPAEAEVTGTICKECGETIPNDSEFCPSCGVKKE